MAKQMNRKGAVSITWLVLIVAIIMGFAISQAGINSEDTKKAINT